MAIKLAIVVYSLQRYHQDGRLGIKSVAVDIIGKRLSKLIEKVSIMVKTAEGVSYISGGLLQYPWQDGKFLARSSIFLSDKRDKEGLFLNPSYYTSFLSLSGEVTWTTFSKEIGIYQFSGLLAVNKKITLFIHIYPEGTMLYIRARPITSTSLFFQKIH